MFVSRAYSSQHFLHFNDSPVGGARGDAHINDLHGELEVKVAKSEHGRPESLVARQRVHARGQAHAVELRAKQRVGCDFVLVLECERLERRAERVQRRAQMADLTLLQTRAHRLERLGSHLTTLHSTHTHTATKHGEERGEDREKAGQRETGEAVQLSGYTGERHSDREREIQQS